MWFNVDHFIQLHTTILTPPLIHIQYSFCEVVWVALQAEVAKKDEAQGNTTRIHLFNIKLGWLPRAFSTKLTRVVYSASVPIRYSSESDVILLSSVNLFAFIQDQNIIEKNKQWSNNNNTLRHLENLKDKQTIIDRQVIIKWLREIEDQVTIWWDLMKFK